MSRTVVHLKLPKDLIKYLVIAAGLLLLSLFAPRVLGLMLRDLFLILGFIFVGAISRLPQRMAPFSIGIELVSLVTIIGAIRFHPLVGVLIGVTAVALSGFYTIERPQDVFIMLLGFTLLGWFAPATYAHFGSLALAALVLTIAYDLGTNFFYIFLGHPPASCLRFSILHLPSNYFILQYAGPALLAL